jgi:hypothetical protein
VRFTLIVPRAARTSDHCAVASKLCGRHRAQIGFIFPIAAGFQGYLNFKGYKEFWAENRPEGWNAWVTFAISPAAECPQTVSRPPMK